jgi:hypothetical protein
VTLIDVVAAAQLRYSPSRMVIFLGFSRGAEFSAGPAELA